MLDNLRQKPESYKKKVQLVSSLALTGVIAFVWFTLNTSNPLSGAQNQIAAAGKVIVTPIGAVSKDASDMTIVARKTLREVKKRFSLLTENFSSLLSK